ncbi:hypothetical protein [Isoptericola croceus]|uniref:hypothetical protein n=1 Tax=Isoptericola croceus TaxID=3031406 RepID=UPI0023F6A814|nr:hypothetical protein [Isoptericola croceus]
MRRLEVGGQWVLIDVSGAVLSVGDQELAGISHRTVLDVVGTRVLHPAMMAAITGGQDEHTSHATFDDARLDICVRVLRTPHSGTIVGALGLAAPADQHCDAPPEVGCWEWVIEPGVPAQRTAYWDDVMAKIYEDSTVDPGKPRDVARWFSDRVEPASKLRLADLIEQGVRQPVDELHIVGYCVLDPIGSGQVPMRLVARAGTDDAGRVYLRGLSHASDDQVRERLPALDEPHPELQVLDMFRLDVDAAFMTVDVTYGTFERQAEEGWARIGLRDVSSGYLSELVHPDDLSRLNAFVDDAAGSSSASLLVVRLADRGGAHRWVRMSAMPLSGSIALRQIVCRIVPVDLSDRGAPPEFKGTSCQA